MKRRTGSHLFFRVYINYACLMILFSVVLGIIYIGFVNCLANIIAIIKETTAAPNILFTIIENPLSAAL